MVLAGLTFILWAYFAGIHSGGGRPGATTPTKTTMQMNSAIKGETTVSVQLGALSINQTIVAAYVNDLNKLSSGSGSTRRSFASELLAP